MGSLNIDPNAWYQINVTKQTGQSFRGTVLYDDAGARGAAFFELTNASSPAQAWQFFPFNASVYLLRCQVAGPTAYLGAKRGSGNNDDGDAGGGGGGGGDDPGADVTGDTLPYMVRYDAADASMFWEAGLWADGTIYLYNLANGSDWRLDVGDDSLMVLSSNITAPQPGEQVTYSKVRAINDESWSTYNTYPATKTAQATTTTTPTTPTGTNPSQQSPSSSSSTAAGGGLSTGAAVGIGVGVGSFAILLAALLGTLLLLRRRRRRRRGKEGGTTTVVTTSAAATAAYTPAATRDEEEEEEEDAEVGMKHGGVGGRQEMAGSEAAAEMPHTEFRAELAGDDDYGVRGPSGGHGERFTDTPPRG